MSDAFPSGSHFYATTPIVQYPPEFFSYGAAGYRHVLAVLNDLALAASSNQAAPAPSPAKKRRGVPAPYGSTKDSRGHHIWRAVINSIPSPSKERITAAYPGCCDETKLNDWSTLRKHQFSASHARHLKDEDLQYIPIGLCPACPEDLGCKDEGQRVDIYSQKGRHFDTCAAYHALCARTSTKPGPISTNRADVKALLEQRDRLRVSMGFKTPKNVPSTFPITPLPLLTPVTHVLPSNGACDLSPVGRQHSPSGSTSAPSLAPFPCSSTASSRMLPPIEYTDVQNCRPLPLIHNPSTVPIDRNTQCDLHGTKSPEWSFPAHLPPSHARDSGWNSVQNLATPMRPDTLSVNDLCAGWGLLAANSAPECRQMTFQSVPANIGTNALKDFHLHAGILQEDFTVYNEKVAHVNGDGGPFLSSGEESLEVPPSGVNSDALCRTARFGLDS